MRTFLELLTHFHRWCGTDAAFPDTPEAWLATQGLAPPDTLDAWLALGRTLVGAWGLATLPAGWDPAWRILSRQERTLTVEALEYLERHGPPPRTHRPSSGSARTGRLRTRLPA